MVITFLIKMSWTDLTLGNHMKIGLHQRVILGYMPEGSRHMYAVFHFYLMTEKGQNTM